MEHKGLNIIEVFIYNACCYLCVGLIPSPLLPATHSAMIFFQIWGSIVLLSGVSLTFHTLRLRNAIGIQKTPNGLIKTGPYQMTRHPIYLGIIFISLGLGLLTLNVEGLLFFPVIVLINYGEDRKSVV